MTRDLELSEGMAVTVRFIEPPADYGFFLDANPSIPMRGIMKPAGGEKEIVIAPGLNHVLWGACRDNQTAAEGSIENAGVRGAFTYCFCKVLRRAGVNVARRRIHDLVCAYLKTKRFSQVPQLEGTQASMAERMFT
jgi:hypothetical protein